MSDPKPWPTLANVCNQLSSELRDEVHEHFVLRVLAACEDEALEQVCALYCEGCRDGLPIYPDPPDVPICHRPNANDEARHCDADRIRRLMSLRRAMR